MLGSILGPPMGAKNLEKPMENQQFYKSADAEPDLNPEPFPSPNPSPSLLNIISFSLMKRTAQLRT